MGDLVAPSPPAVKPAFPVDFALADIFPLVGKPALGFFPVGFAPGRLSTDPVMATMRTHKDQLKAAMQLEPTARM